MRITCPCGTSEEIDGDLNLMSTRSIISKTGFYLLNYIWLCPKCAEKVAKAVSEIHHVLSEAPFLTALSLITFCGDFYGKQFTEDLADLANKCRKAD